MGGGGNQSWSGYSQDNQTGLSGQAKAIKSKDAATISADTSSREARISKDKKKEVYKSLETLAREQREREEKAAIKAMTPEQRIEHKASKETLYKMLEKEYKK